MKTRTFEQAHRDLKKKLRKYSWNPFSSVTPFGIDVVGFGVVFLVIFLPGLVFLACAAWDFILN